MKRFLLLTLISTAVGSMGMLYGAQPPKSEKGGAAASKKIDEILAAEWKQNKVEANPTAPDEVFVRRLYLDVVGRIPTYRETEEFMASKEKNKRSALIDKLLASEGYVQHMFNYWADILRAQTDGQARAITGAAFIDFIKDSLRANKPYDKFVREMVSSQGKAWDHGAIGYYLRDRGMPLDNMASTVRIFLGTRIECAQCHNHPFDKWSQKQFYEMAAFTFGVNTTDYYIEPMEGVKTILDKEEAAMRASMKVDKPTEITKKAERLAVEKLRKDRQFLNQALQDVRDPLRYTAVGLSNRKLVLPHDYQYPDAKPRSPVGAVTMMGEKLEYPAGTTSLEAYAKWMTSKDNPRFTNLIANRLWKKVFGLGLIEPVDELMDTTVASNPELMKHLEGLMISLNYDMKAYLRVLLNTQTYQRSVTREEIVAGSSYHFTGPILRRMSAEQMWDSFVTLINPTPDMPNEFARDQGEKRIAAAKSMSESLEALGPEKILEGAKKSSLKYEAQAATVKAKQAEIAEARAAGDKDTAKKISSDLNTLYREVRGSVRENILVPAAAKLAAVSKSGSKGKAVSTPGAGAGGGAMMEGSSMMMSGDTMMVPGFDRMPEVRKEMTAKEEKALREEAKYFGITDEKQIKRYVSDRRNNIRTWVRAAEISSPAPRGHYLREFGQSDRETIENANHDASVPQALALMNSALLPGIMSTNSSLMLTINKMPYPEDKVEAAYMTILSRPPTATEKEVWQKASEKGLDKMEDLIYALINTQQFIFIQ